MVEVVYQIFSIFWQTFETGIVFIVIVPKQTAFFYILSKNVNFVLYI